MPDSPDRPSFPSFVRVCTPYPCGSSSRSSATDWPTTMASATPPSVPASQQHTSSTLRRQSVQAATSLAADEYGVGDAPALSCDMSWPSPLLLYAPAVLLVSLTRQHLPHATVLCLGDSDLGSDCRRHRVSPWAAPVDPQRNAASATPTPSSTACARAKRVDLHTDSNIPPP